MTKKEAQQLKPGDVIRQITTARIRNIMFTEDGMMTIEYGGGTLECYPEDVEKVEE